LILSLPRFQTLGKKMILWGIGGLLLWGGMVQTAQAQIDRRRDQYPHELGYFLFPAPYSMPGIGEGLMVVASVTNIADTDVDTFLIYLTGALEGYVGGLDDVYVVPKHVAVGFWGNRFTKASMFFYNSRGMNTKKDDYVIGLANRYSADAPQVRFHFWDRRLNLGYRKITAKATAIGYNKPDGTPLVRPPEPITVDMSQEMRWAQLDFTDDYYDPHRGVQLLYIEMPSLTSDVTQPEFTTVTSAAKVFLPMGRVSTWGFAYFSSDSKVQRMGETNRTAVENTMCNPADPAYANCLKAVAPQVDNTLAHNQYGDAESLGGQNMLRSYPGGRFKAAHMRYWSTEFRWSLTEEVTPFNYYIWKDIRTSIQVAFFYEQGTVADQTGDLWKDSRNSYGMGLRLVTLSGLAYRADWATGKEGSNTTIIFNYPW